MNILAIGNSFSQDATRYLKQIGDSALTDLYVVNLYIGGCPLERHADNARADRAAYAYERGGVPSNRTVSIREALEERPWDVVTVQQASHDSGMPETYEPYGTELLDYVRRYAPQAKIYFHMTWAYETDSTHDAFPRYHRDQQEMYRRICQAAEAFTAAHDLPVIPAGKVIQALRQTPEFDYAHGGMSLNRDGFHMSWDYGRYAVAATWFETLTGGDIRTVPFAPDCADPARIDLIRRTVHEICTK